jgi:hypothetical protein
MVDQLARIGGREARIAAETYRISGPCLHHHI